VRTFLEGIFARLEQASNSPVLCEIRDGQVVSVTGKELLALVARARQYLAARELKEGDRCALLGPNSIRWAALDLAMMAEGLIVVPLYARQAPGELAGMMKDSTPSLVCCADAPLVAEVQKQWPAAPTTVMLDAIFEDEESAAAPPRRHAAHDAVTIIYTSGTSGEPKGVVLNAGNVGCILGCTNERLDQLMGLKREADRIFHYAPFCFAASWILLLTALSRNSVLFLSTDLAKIAEEMKIASPNYFLNVPTLLERVRARIEDAVRQRGGLARAIFEAARGGYNRERAGQTRLVGLFSLWLARMAMFPAIRKGIGPNLKALICGSAPLSLETQLFFMMLGIPVLQVYGLTETTAISTMDHPREFEPGCVGRAIPGVEMTVGANSEILVRGPNIFPGYWRRPDETATALEGGWFHTGDQGEVDAAGNWRITGRLKNLIILNSGHNIAPEPIEQTIAARLPEAQQVVLLGNQRSFLSALVTITMANGSFDSRIRSVLDAVNAGLPHYKQIRAFRVIPEPFSAENGLLTTMGKIKREAIAARFAAEIEQMYQKKSA
jgi:long-chain acyl-CoA synthetase